MELNKYIKELNRVEFVITDACTGRCKHCSEGKLLGRNKLDGIKASKSLKELTKYFDIKSIMTFGGEALLYPEEVCKIHKVAKDAGIKQRQLITNGCFSRDKNRINEVTRMLEEKGVNDILLSVDCFHVEKLPLEWVRQFAESLKKNYNGNLHLQPSWVRDRNEDNPYNIKTKECLEYFSDLNIECNEGDIIFLQGNAVKYLSEYFEKKEIDLNFKCGEALYSSDLRNINEISIDSNGDVIPCNFSIGNIYKKNIIEIIKDYNPYKNKFTKALVTHGIKGLIQEAKKQGINIDTSKFYSPCGVCNYVFRSIKDLN